MLVILVGTQGPSKITVWDPEDVAKTLLEIL